LLPIGSCDLPLGKQRATALFILNLVLLQMGFTEPISRLIAGEAFNSPFHPCQSVSHFTALTTNSVWLPKKGSGGIFLLHFPWGHPHWVLPSILP